MLQSSKKEQKNKKLNKIIDNSIQKKMAFSLFYLGIDYHGFEKQQNHHNTIEAHLFTALKKTMLIKEIESAFFYLIMIYNPLGFNRDYTRAGRTDKGVSAFSNVIALKVRTLAKTETKNQLNYVKIINCNLPEDIRIIAFAEVPDDFNARYHCTAREYRYYFVRNLLNVDKMKDACKNYIGEHDFRNFCKINPTNTLDFK